MSASMDTLIRSYCDGELDRGRAAELERRIAEEPELAARVRSEEALRERVRRVMQVPVPADLEGQVRAALRSVEAPLAPATTPRPAPAAAPPRHRRIVLPQRPNVFAIAASLAVVAGAVLFGIFGSQIDHVGPQAPTQLVTDMARYAASEHARCAKLIVNREMQAVWREADLASARLRDRLGAPVPVVDLSQLGYRFVGAGTCQMPGGLPAGHIMYAKRVPASDGCPEAMLSIFVVPDRGQCDGDVRVDRRPWSWTKIGEPPLCTKHVACSTDGKVLYLAVCCDRGDLPELADEVAWLARQ